MNKTIIEVKGMKVDFPAYVGMATKLVLINGISEAHASEIVDSAIGGCKHSKVYIHNTSIKGVQRGIKMSSSVEDILVSEEKPSVKKVVLKKMAIAVLAISIAFPVISAVIDGAIVTEDEIYWMEVPVEKGDGYDRLIKRHNEGNEGGVDILELRMWAEERNGYKLQEGDVVYIPVMKGGK